MASKKYWSKEEIFSLIALWESYPELWNVKNKDYRNRIKKQNALKELAAQFNSQESEISRKLHNLRTQFHQEIRRRKMRESGGDAYETIWEYFSAMRFINSDRSNPTTIDNFEQHVEKATEEHEIVIKYEEIYSDRSEQPKKRKSCGKFMENKTQHEPLLKQAASPTNKSADEFQIFGDFVASELRNLKSEEYRQQLKLTIQRAIIKFSELSLSSPLTIDSNSCSSTLY